MQVTCFDMVPLVWREKHQIIMLKIVHAIVKKKKKN